MNIFVLNNSCSFDIFNIYYVKSLLHRDNEVFEMSIFFFFFHLLMFRKSIDIEERKKANEKSLPSSRRIVSRSATTVQTYVICTCILQLFVLASSPRMESEEKKGI